MPVSPHAGQLAQPADRTDIPNLISAYYTLAPNPLHPKDQVSFGTSGHRGNALNGSFNEAHILAITQAVCDVRRHNHISGPLFLGKDTHALSEPAFRTALEVLAANGVQVRVQTGGGYTPTPAISHAILCWNQGRTTGLADGIVITPSHNPPDNGGFKYNPPSGGPAGTSTTNHIEDRANELLLKRNRGVQRISYAAALRSGLVVEHDYIRAYVNDLDEVIDFPCIAEASLTLGVNPLGGASLGYWEPIAYQYGLNIRLLNDFADPTFSFVPRDHDGKIRMDCSSPWAMAELLHIKDDFDLAFALDPDSDRHGIVTPQGLMNPNHYLSVVAAYLMQHRPQWSAQAAIGKTVVTSAMLDRVAAEEGHPLLEVPVGFKWFVEGLQSGTCALGCEESAGASFLRKNGTAWSTDKDGLILGLLAAEITARTGKNPAQHYEDITARLGKPIYRRIDSPLDDAGKAALTHLNASQVHLKELAGSPITAVLTHAPGNNAPIGGIKVVSDDGWFAVRPSGTEPLCKVYMEGFRDEVHFARLEEDALAFVKSIMA